MHYLAFMRETLHAHVPGCHVCQHCRQELSRLAAARPADEMAALATQAAHAQADKEAAAAALAERDKAAATTAAECKL